MNIRKYKSVDCNDIVKLFYETVHTVNLKDYTKAQLNVWATRDINVESWDKSFLKHNTIVVEKNNIILGFGDMDNKGYLDKIYVDKNHQGKGIATAIVNELEKQAKINGVYSFYTHASITAKPFFQKLGYIVISENIVVRSGVELANFIMRKDNTK